MVYIQENFKIHLFKSVTMQLIWAKGPSKYASALTDLGHFWEKTLAKCKCLSLNPPWKGIFQQFPGAKCSVDGFHVVPQYFHGTWV